MILAIIIAISSSSALAQTIIFSENFEGVFPNSNWASVTDLDSTNSLDYWDDSNAQAYGGSWSGWNALIGTQDTTSNAFTDAFTFTILGSWTTQDSNPASGTDYWGASSYRSYSGSYSAYSADSSNVAGQFYDNDMIAWMYRSNGFNANSWTSAKIKYRVWSITEMISSTCCDYVVPVYTGTYTGASGSNTWNWQNSWRHFGNTNGWQYYERTIPTSALTSNFDIGFRFYSDSSVTYEGSYIDDVTLEYTTTQSNAAAGQYDDYMDAEMRSSAINLYGYATPVLEYFIKTDSEQCCDHFKTQISTDGSNWNTLLDVTGSVNNNQWAYQSHSLSAYQGQTIYLRFLFDTDYSVHNFPGTYLDSIVVSGTQLLPNGQQCAAPSQCISNSCGGAHTDIWVHCNNDQAPTAYGDRLNYANSCGGAGVYTGTNNDYYFLNCPTNEVCDSDLAHTEYSTTVFYSNSICRNDLYTSCTSSSQCWNDNGGVNCIGPSGNRICTYGTVGSQCADDAHCNSGRCDEDSGSPNGYSCQSQLSSGSQCNENSDCSNNNCNYGVCGGSNPSYTLQDTWAYDGSTNNDGIAFTNYEIRPSTFGHTGSADMLCYDFNQDNSLDSCYYDNAGCSGCSATSCNLWSGVISGAGFSNFVNAPKYGCDIDDGDGCIIGVDTPSMICPTCTISTTNPSHKSITGIVMYDCDDSSYLSNIEMLPSSAEYSLISPKFAYCQTNTTFIHGGNEGELFTGGYYIPFGTSQTCGSTQTCSHDLDYIYGATQPIPNPCRTLNGYSCNLNQTCSSGLCAQTLCNAAFSITGRFVDQNGGPLSNQQLSLINCANNITTQSTISLINGSFSMIDIPANYSFKVNNSWGTFWFSFNNSYCYDMTEGSWTFNDIVFSTTTFVDGTLIDKQSQNPTPNHDVMLTSCLDQLNNQSSSDTQGYFSMTSEIGLHKLKVNVQGYNFSIVEAASGNDCTFFFDNEHLGVIEIPENLSCGGWDNTCYNENSRLFNCHFNYNQTNPSCLCYYEQCSFGCTESAPTCNGVGTGTMRAAVSQPNGIPVKGANVTIDSLLAGHTSSLGKKEVNLDYGYHNITTYCPGGTFCQSSNVLLNSSSVALVHQCSCGIVGPQGNVTLFVTNNESRPVVNAYVFVDGNYEEYEGFTNPLGTVRVSNLSYGMHSLAVVYKFANETTSAVYRKTVSVLINQPDLNLSVLALTPNNPGFSSYGAEQISDQELITLGIIGAAALDVVSLSMSVNDFCGCLLGSGSPDLTTCITSIGACKDDVRNCPPSLAHLASKASTDCWLESAMFGLDVGSPFIPTGIITHFAVLPIKKGWSKVAKAGVGEYLGKTSAKTWDFLKDFGNNVAEWTGNSFRISKKFGVNPSSLSDEGLQAADDIFERATNSQGLKISPKITTRMFRKFTEVFGEQYSKRIFEGLGALKSRNIPGVNGLEDNLIISAKTFDDNIAKLQKAYKKNLKPNELNALIDGNYPVPSSVDKKVVNNFKSAAGDVRGRAFEIESASNSQFINNLRKVDVKIYRPDGSQLTDLDMLLNNNVAVSVKHNGFDQKKVKDSYFAYETARLLPTNIPSSPNYFNQIKFVFKGQVSSQIQTFLAGKNIPWEVIS